MQTNHFQRIFFTSDLHFGHKNILRYAPEYRPYTSVEQMDQALIQLWNQQVSPHDIVYNLGDFSFHKDVAQSKKILGRLNGQHHFIYGNHDDQLLTIQQELLQEKKADGNPYLSSIQSYLEITIQTVPTVLFHYPIYEWNNMYRGAFMLYGHLHRHIAPVEGRLLNVGFDRFGHLLSEHEVVAHLAHLPIRTPPYNT
ncbi:MAG: metallophosphoesterase family protein [Acinetobacter sp.]|nr:metallophosphoesterase family protein [Acinetobacter sp.]